MTNSSLNVNTYINKESTPDICSINTISTSDSDTWRVSTGWARANASCGFDFDINKYVSSAMENFYNDKKDNTKNNTGGDKKMNETKKVETKKAEEKKTTIDMNAITPEYVEVQKNGTTVVRWMDKTVTVVKCSEGDSYNTYSAFCAALAKKLYGSNSRVHKTVDEKLVSNINAKKEKEHAKMLKELRERQKMLHERKIRRLAKRLRNNDEAFTYLLNKDEMTYEGETINEA